MIAGLLLSAFLTPDPNVAQAPCQACTGSRYYCCRQVSSCLDPPPATGRSTLVRVILCIQADPGPYLTNRTDKGSWMAQVSQKESRVVHHAHLPAPLIDPVTHRNG
jgi:hypothetical protein